MPLLPAIAAAIPLLAELPGLSRAFRRDAEALRRAAETRRVQSQQASRDGDDKRAQRLRDRADVLDARAAVAS